MLTRAILSASVPAAILLSVFMVRKKGDWQRYIGMCIGIFPCASLLMYLLVPIYLVETPYSHLGVSAEWITWRPTLLTVPFCWLTLLGGGFFYARTLYEVLGDLWGEWHGVFWSILTAVIAATCIILDIRLSYLLLGGFLGVFRALVITSIFAIAMWVLAALSEFIFPEDRVGVW